MDKMVLRGYYWDGINNVRNDMDNIKKNYINMGYHLREIKEMGWYQYDYSEEQFEKFCKDRLNLSKSTVYRLIQIVDKFCKPNEPILQDQYCNFSQSQLTEMISMSDDDILYVKPDMTIKEIRQLKSYESSDQEHNGVVPRQLHIIDTDCNVGSNKTPVDELKVATSQHLTYDYIKNLTDNLISSNKGIDKKFNSGYNYAFQVLIDNLIQFK